jgi:lipopolysaccharide transport system permease protein
MGEIDSDRAPLPLYRAGMLRECWDFRGFILASVRRDFVSRYLGTNLGFVWALAQPVAMIAIYTLVFAEIMRPALPGHASRFAYGLHLCTGMILWQLFSDLLGRGVLMFVQNATLLKKVSVPKLGLALIATLSALLNFAVLAGVFILFLLAAGMFQGSVMLALVPVVVLVVVFAAGLGTLLGCINVFYRDVAQAVTLALQFWFWLTPIVYPADALPRTLANAIAWNPLTPIVQYAQTVVLDGRVPSPSSLMYPLIIAVLSAILGWVMFRKLSGEIVDEL